MVKITFLPKLQEHVTKSIFKQLFKIDVAVIETINIMVLATLYIS